MKHADEVLEDEQVVATVYEALAKRSPKSRTRGRRGTSGSSAAAPAVELKPFYADLDEKFTRLQTTLRE
jgi:hypothetical protein